MSFVYNFFADNNDLKKLLSAFSVIGDYKYVERRSHLNAANKVTTVAAEILDQCIVSSSRKEKSQTHIVVPDETEVVSRNIELRDGSGRRTIVDQNQNPHSIMLAFGGEIDQSVLIISEIMTNGETSIARDVFERFRACVQENTISIKTKSGAFRFMHGARTKALEGWRLARGLNWSKDTDIELTESPRNPDHAC